MSRRSTRSIRAASAAEAAEAAARIGFPVALKGDGHDHKTDAGAVAYVFKTQAEAQFGEMSFFRVYAGQVKFGGEMASSTEKTTWGGVKSMYR